MRLRIGRLLGGLSGCGGGCGSGGPDEFKIGDTGLVGEHGEQRRSDAHAPAVAELKDRASVGVAVFDEDAGAAG